MIRLRDYQVEAVDAVQREIKAGNTATAVVLPTGTGKTTVLAEAAYRHHSATGQRVLVLSHTTEIMGQIAERVHQHTGDYVGQLGAGIDSTSGAPYVSAMVQTLRTTARLEAMARTHVGMIIVDECHRAAANSYQTILGHLGTFRNLPTVGFTATLDRGDKLNLSDTWESIAYKKSIRWAINEGHLCPVRGKSVVLEDLELSGVRTTGGDYAEGALGEVIEAEIGGIVDAWQTHGEGRKTMAFVPSVSSAWALATEFADRHIEAAVVVGDTSAAERADIYRKFADGEITVLVSVAVLTEGFDMPSVECVLMARPTKLAHVYIQAAGRGLRPSPGKTDCLILDVVGVSRMHSLMTLAVLEPSSEYERVSSTGALDEELEAEIEAVEAEANRQGVERLEDVDLFAASDRLWLRTHGGVRFIPAGDRAVFLWPVDGTEDQFYVGSITTKGERKGGFVGPYGLTGMGQATVMDLETAREVAESEAVSLGASYATKASSWRNSRQPSDAQVRYGKRLGIVDADLYTKARLSDEISIALASRRLDIA